MDTWTFTKFLPAYRCLLFGLLYLYWSNGATGQNLQERDGVCNAEGCYSIHLQRKTFRESWRICKDKGGNLATVKRPEEASLIHELLSSGVRRPPRPRIRLWIGLQRQPRQCSATRPLRGFTWITGDQETQYTNWQRDDVSNACAAHRCVVITYNTADRSGSDQNNFKWLDGSCTVAVDGFLCRYSYQGMCPALQKEGGGPALYTTPFHLVSTVLTHIPFGTVATVPCPEGEKEDQSVLCMLREDGSVGWSKDAPLCTDIVSKDWCEHENGGCEHYCVNTDKHYFCECSEKYELGEDGTSCQHSDPCQTANCEFECEVTPQGQRCKCPEGYLLSDDGQNCLDIDECLQQPCPQVCVNTIGTFECLCNEGYLPTEFGECLDVDECMEGKCDHLCENLPGSYVCSCHEGFSSNGEDPDQCEDADECEIPNMCHQICRNFEGGFECLCEDGYLLQEDRYNCWPIEDDVEHLTTVSADATLNEPYELVTDASPPEWLTDSPSIDWVPTYLNWFTETEQERDMITQEADLSEQVSSKSHSSHIWMDTTTSAHADSNDEDAKLWLNEEINPNGDTADARTFEDNRLIASTPIPKNRDFVVLTPAASQTPEGTLASVSGTEQQKKHDKSWLLVALLVPLCVFIVVMLALGIVYCTSCAVEPRNKSITDCYRWATTAKPEKPNTAKSRA
ncbi:Endosialin Tumor endothelial marker 1 [Triplophysa tibetana]|uniref:Endosialin Tumor endothelial marker 1 n=1 Tax=Triplophysa tibetana TaxID=1572043 RepID=A0A5A9PDZ3_9TELE|nr:Endosialin Tumor endothelial marker 1 [Triplophysa tibetana]